MNRLIDYIITERNGHYCHALELANYYEYECVIEQVVSDYKDRFTLDEIIGFFKSIELYYYYDADSYDDEYKLTEEQQKNDEEDLYNFDYIECIKYCYE